MMRQLAYKWGIMCNLVYPDKIRRADLMAALLGDAIHRERGWLFAQRWECKACHHKFETRLKQWDRFLARIAKEFQLSEPEHISWHPESVAEMAKDNFSLAFDSRESALKQIISVCQKLLEENK